MKTMKKSPKKAMSPKKVKSSPKKAKMTKKMPMKAMATKA
jgi:hypothetical protein